MASWTAYSTWIPQKPTLFNDHNLRNHSTLDIGVLGYIGIVQHKEHSRSFVHSSWDTLHIRDVNCEDQHIGICYTYFTICTKIYGFE